MARNPNPIVPPGRQRGESAVGPTHSYRVIPQKADSYIDILRRSQPDLKFHTNGGDNESGISFGQPNIMNGNRWNYDAVKQGPFTQDWQKGSVAFDGRDTAHRHISGEVANASWQDLNKFHNRLLDAGDDNTMSITDSYRNIAVYGLPETLKKRGFNEDQFMNNE